MAWTKTNTLMIVILFLCLLLLLQLRAAWSVEASDCKFRDSSGSGGDYNNSRRIKGMFVFGSSLVDNGNNNFLVGSIAKANYFPYGVDFPELGASGRFTNGENVVDLLGDTLNLPHRLPVFSDPSTRGPVIVNGVNFASGGSGILDDTGSLAGRVMSLNEQITKFEEITIAELEAEVLCRRGDGMQPLLADYLFVVGSGGNDYAFNYFLTRSAYNHQNVTLHHFTSNLISLLSHHLTRLYAAGGRKFVLMSVNPLGCSPMAQAYYGPKRSGCNQRLNRAAHLFNSQLKSLVDSFQIQMPGSNLVLVNSYKIIRDIIKNPASRGYENATGGCCQVLGISEGGNGVLCKRGGEICPNRSTYVFFDGLHPTQAVNVEIAAKAFYSNLKTEVYPINVNHLSNL